MTTSHTVEAVAGAVDAPETLMTSRSPSDLSGSKRKEPEKRKHSFKAIGQLVLAMRRFSNSLNPTYTYGKRTTSTSSGAVCGKAVTEETDAAAVSSADGKQARTSLTGRGGTSPRPTSPEGHEEHAKYAYSTHGHKFDFLLKPLPPTEDEEAAAAQA